MTQRPEKIWITWENQRRTNELSKSLEAPLYKYLSNSPYLMRAFLLSVRTTLTLASVRPRKLIVQNPSMVLAALACLLRRVFGFRLIVDRHSNFKFDTMGRWSLKYRIFHFLSRYTIRKADLTIVTNEFLKGVVESWGGTGFVLPDKLPTLSLASKMEVKGKSNIAFVCSYNRDEPTNAAMEAARLLGDSIFVYMTGNSAKLSREILDNAPANVVFTGFLDEKDYQSLLLSCDAVMALTTQDHTLLCGAYEAISLGKPLILSDTKALREYFRQGAVYAENTSAAIAEAMQQAVENNGALRNEIAELAGRLRESWNLKFNLLKNSIDSL